MSHWVWHNVWQVNGGWSECDYCLNTDSQTCCMVLTPIATALLFFTWLFFQKGHFAVGLVLGQLLGTILFGVLAFLCTIALSRCWRRCRARRKGTSTTTSSIMEA